MKTLIGAPKRQINHASTKNRNPRETTDAATNPGSAMPNNPPEIVKSLKGMGVNPAVKMIQKSHRSNSSFTPANPSRVKTPLLKNQSANAVLCPSAVCHKKYPIA